MADDSPKFSLVRCLKCDRLLPELPPYSVYRCGGCDGLLKAHKTSVLSGNVSLSSSEGRFSDASEWSTPRRVSDSPLRLKFGGLTTSGNEHDDEGDHGVERRNRNRSSNYRAELLREYNELHVKLIRLGDLISCSRSGQGDQSYSSRNCYGGVKGNSSSVDSKSDEGFCHPIVGGAPFVICSNCLQLLRLPGKLITAKKSQFRLQCGSCHTIISLDFNKKSSSAITSDSAVQVLLPLRPPPCSPLRGSDKKDAQTNAAVPTELEVKSSEIPNTDSPRGSADTNIRRDEVRSSESNLRSSFAIAHVFVNGVVINPNAIRRAEKLAGPISPGEYWYDSRAGFWGAIGNHCLGIIPPFIEEFSSKMPENCSGGETCIYVNGRELHQNDLDLLSPRGLPCTRFKYYVVDKSGKVHDEDTGAFVVNLGKLAPTVESTGCGFGMRFPKAQKQ